MAEDSFWSSLPTVLTALGGILTAGATLVGALYSAGLIGRREAVRPRQEPRGEDIATPSTPQPARPALELRRVPAILTPQQVKVTLVRLGIYDSRWNAAASGCPASYETRAIGDALIVVDAAHGLTWQRGASPSPLTFDKAEAHIRQLNAALFAGHADWRLPTLEEAGTLLVAEAQQGLHVDPTFEKGAYFVWTADRHPDGRIWMIYFADGLVASERPEFNAWVRAVR